MTEQLQEVLWEEPRVGDHVKVVTETRETVNALVVAVHGQGSRPEGRIGSGPYINVVFVSTNPDKHDPYGQQLERYSSLGHRNMFTTMTNPGRYWYQDK